jgi:hypothetical protein
MKTSEQAHLSNPKHCFCQIDPEELKKWAIKRYREGYSTTELLASTDDPHEKEVIGIVALLDVDEKTMLKMMGELDNPLHYVLHCRERVQDMLKAELGK